MVVYFIAPRFAKPRSPSADSSVVDVSLVEDGEAEISEPDASVFSVDDEDAAEAHRGSSAEAFDSGDAPAASESMASEGVRYLSLDRIPQASPDVICWGVLRINASAFRVGGKRISERAPGGTLAEITQFVKTKDGVEMARCRLEHNSKWYGPYLIASADIVIYEGTRRDVFYDDLKNLCEYYKVWSAIKAREDELYKSFLNKNPHYRKLRDVTAEYNKMQDSIPELTKKRDSSSGTQRIKYADELRAIEVKQAKMKNEIKELTKQYEKWKASHSMKSYSSDARYKALLKRLKRILPKVQNIFGVTDIIEG